MKLLTSLFGIHDRFINRRIPKNCLDILPNDILIEIMSCYLEVVEVICLRMASRLYCELTRQPCVWKRILGRVNIPLPPIPPSPQHSIKRMSGLEAERILTRAYSLEKNWSTHHPRTLDEWSFHTHHRLHSMTLLPGGDYLIASVSNPVGSRYSLAVYAMNTVGPPRAIAAIDTPTKVYEIKAKYMTINNQRSIVIAYVSRDYYHKTDRKRAALGRLQDVSQYSTYHRIDPDIKFRYECVAMHVTLESLESLLGIPHPTDTREYRREASFLPAPFVYLVSVRSRSALRYPVLDDMFGSPYLAVVKGANDIVFKRLEWGASATLTCMEMPAVAQSNHTIKAIRLLPNEHSVFVVREVDVPLTHQQRCPIYLFETYLALKSGETQVSQLHAAENCVLSWTLGYLSHIYIPDVPPSSSSQAKVLSPDRDPVTPTNHSQFPADSPLPAPISILAHRSNEEAIIRVLFYYQRIVVEPPPSPPSAGGPRNRGDGAAADARCAMQVIFRLNLQKNWYWECVGDPNGCMHIIPGLTRPLIYWTAWDDISDAPEVQFMRPLIDRGWQKPRELDEEDVVVQPRGWIGCPAFDGSPNELNMRVSAFAWDETIGRLIIAEEDSDEVHVCDFAAARGPAEDEWMGFPRRY